MKISSAHVVDISTFSYCERWRDLHPHLEKMRKGDVTNAERDGFDQPEKLLSLGYKKMAVMPHT